MSAPPHDPIDDLAEDFARRWRAGERPRLEEYAGQHPDRADEIRAMLSAVVMMEQLKPRRQDAGPPPVPLPPPAAPPDRLGDYRIVREIGRGGMGVVYEAHQESLHRRVAIKVLPGHLLANENLRARFRREAQAAARLHHTNIVPVFGVEERDGLCFYVMQLIDGLGLDRVIRSLGDGTEQDRQTASRPDEGAGEDTVCLSPRPPASLSPHEVARIGAQVADALAHAHAEGVLHRDIKPSNLLLDDRRAVWVTDFGVAKLVEEANLTQSGDLVGTLKYMPPERFSGVSEARGDVYSLGVTLYELLTLRPAFPDTSPQHLIQLITHEAPPPPRKVNPAVPADLETIVLKAAARDPAHRYQTPAELAEDLRRFLSDRPILARRTGPAALAYRWCRRNPALAAACATAALLMAAVTAVSAGAYFQTAAANRETQQALAAEKAQRAHAERTSTLALDALNRTFDRFAPARLVVTPPAAGAEGVEVPPQPALPPVAAALLEDLLRTYEQIAGAAAEFPSLHGQAAEANHRIGDIRQRLGRFKPAVAAYRTAVGLYDKLLAAGEPETAVRVKRARAYNDLGRVLRSLQQYDEARRMHEQAVRSLQEAPAGFGDRPECRFETARSYFLLGQRDMLTGPGPRGPGQGPGPRGPRDGRRGPPGGEGPGGNPTRRATALLERLVADFPDVPEYRHLLACCCRDERRDGPGRGRPSPPLSTLARHGRGGNARAVELLEKLVKDCPEVPDYRLDLCETLVGSGPPRRGPQESEEDVGRLKKAITLSADLVLRYPNVPEYTAAHARYYDSLGLRLQDAGELEGAEAAHRKAVRLQTRLVKQYPDAAAYSFWLGLMERSLGRVLSDRGRLVEAKARLKASVERVEELARKDSRLGGARPFLGMAYRDYAKALERAGETAAAAEARRKSETYDQGGGHGPPHHDRDHKKRHSLGRAGESPP
jgi:tetratricopeptide (TPR) repeat protein